MNLAHESFWYSPDNHLLLNPRLPESTRGIYQMAWRRFVDGHQQATIGIATSGSSGEIGRLILQRKEALLASAAAANTHFAADRHDIWLRTLPIFHVGGLQIGSRALLAGSRVVESQLTRWDAAALHREIQASGATLLSLVPTQLFDLIQLGLAAPKTLRAVIVGGGRLEATLQRSARALGWPAVPSYGMTECGSQIATAHPPGDDVRLWPLPHVEVHVGDAQRLSVRSPGLLTAAIRFPNAEPVYEDPKRDGWFTAEDRGRIEADGSLTILGREQDFIKIGGEGVVLSRLEEILERTKLQSGFAADAALLAAHDERLGAKLVLISDRQDTATARLVHAYDRTVMPFERIRETRFVTSIPRSPLGKLRRLEALRTVGLRPVDG